MYTDLFAALLNRENRRGHPILSALLYSFCPAAARWWIEGADPQPPLRPGLAGDQRLELPKQSH